MAASHPTGRPQPLVFVAVIGETVRTTLFPAESSPLASSCASRRGIYGHRRQEKLAPRWRAVFPGPRSTVRCTARHRDFASSAVPSRAAGLTLQEALDLTRVSLRTRFHARPGQEDNFDNLTPDAIRGFIDQLLSMVPPWWCRHPAFFVVGGRIVIMTSCW